MLFIAYIQHTIQIYSLLSIFSPFEDDMYPSGEYTKF